MPENPYHYTVEKPTNVIEVLATHPGDARERVACEFWSCHMLREDDFPKKHRRKWMRFRQEIGKYSPVALPEGVFLRHGGHRCVGTNRPHIHGRKDGQAALGTLLERYPKYPVQVGAAPSIAATAAHSAGQGTPANPRKLQPPAVARRCLEAVVVRHVEALQARREDCSQKHGSSE